MGKLKRKKKTVFRRYRRHHPRTGPRPVFELRYTEDGKVWDFYRKWLDDIQSKYDVSDMWPEVIVAGNPSKSNMNPELFELRGLRVLGVDNGGEKIDPNVPLHYSGYQRTFTITEEELGALRQKQFDYPTSKEEIEFIDNPFLRNALLKVQSGKKKNLNIPQIISELKEKINLLFPDGKQTTLFTKEICDNDIATLYSWTFPSPTTMAARDIPYELQEVSKRELGLCSQSRIVMEPELFELREGEPRNYLNYKKNIPITEEDRKQLETDTSNLISKIMKAPDTTAWFMKFVKQRVIRSLIEDPQQDTLLRTRFTFELVGINNENVEPLVDGWYLCNAVDDRWNGELCYRAWGNGQWWTPFSDGWVSSRMGIYQWVGPVADVNGPAPDGTNPTKKEKIN